jgi:hypothetical protein
MSKLQFDEAIFFLSISNPQFFQLPNTVVDK